MIDSGSLNGNLNLLNVNLTSVKVIGFRGEIMISPVHFPNEKVSSITLFHLRTIYYDVQQSCVSQILDLDGIDAVTKQLSEPKNIPPMSIETEMKL